jgi:hypothetical protein
MGSDIALVNLAELMGVCCGFRIYSRVRKLLQWVVDGRHYLSGESLSSDVANNRPHTLAKRSLHEGRTHAIFPLARMERSN